ncbi:MAG: prolyl oligopeptidase family serine peptidase [Fimbriimonadaceae bacterium]
MHLAVALLLVALQPQNPMAFGQTELVKALGDRVRDVQLTSSPGATKEGYTITPSGGKVLITGTDAVGAMYGAFEFAERYRNDPDRAFEERVEGRPYLQDRGLNLFLCLPWNYAKNDTDYDHAALTDPARWWFHNEHYWTTLLDTMAKSRLNWLDIHGTYDISVTDFPNLYAYFVTSATFPKVGVPQDIKDANLRQLNHVVAMAHARGIRVSLMSYEAKLTVPHNRNPGYENTEPNAYTYTKEVVTEIIKKVPGLDAIGFRIGESGRGESFFNCYTEAVKASGRDIPLITRSWITKRQNVLPLARANKDFTVEIKYNGEHWGAPYMVAGGRVANWYSYSFEDYLSDAGEPEKNAKTWPGNEVPTGGEGQGVRGTWPGNPYKIVWQVRANGTHRIFPFYNPDWVRRTIGTMKIGTASGYTIEGMDAYFPKKPDYYLADPTKKAYDWIHQRDEMYWMTWGRLGYDPTVNDEVFDKQAVRMLTDGSDRTDQTEQLMPLVQAWKQASVLMPWAFMAYALGPDHRSHAPELEWGGDTNAYIQGQGFDTHSFMPINEEFANRVTIGVDGRKSTYSLALGSIPADRELAPDYSAFKAASHPRQRELAQQLELIRALFNYDMFRLMVTNRHASVESALNRQASDARLIDRFQLALEWHSKLANNDLYRPFTDRLRMHTNSFAWSAEHLKVVSESTRVSALPITTEPIPFYAANMDGPTHGKLTWSGRHDEVEVKFDSAGAERAWLLVKPLPSSTYFHSVPMQKQGVVFTASFKRERWGHMIAVEAANETGAARFPDVSNETPYLIVPSLTGPTPQIYSAEEAMTYLNPEVISKDKHGAMIIGTRGWRFFANFDNSTKRKVLEPVSKGMTLLILQQDFNRYKLDWLPKPLKFESGNWATFDPAGQLGLEKTDTADAMWQRFLPSEGWEVFGNGGVARLKHGEGSVWVVSARLMQRMHIPSAARNLVKLLSIGGKTKPTVLIDSNSEGADFSSSNHPDLMNSHDVPFLTLGEVIAIEQGMDSFTPVPGPASYDDVLGGKGRDTVNAWLKAEVVKAAKRARPTSRDAFEIERQRRKKELLRSLGMDPMPEKTPLNARTTGTLLRTGYRIEKIVFESRPGFYVTAHVYAPYPPTNTRGPVIVNVNGHWAHKKNEDRVQLRAAFQAIRGYVAIAIDSPGHSFEGNSLIERRAQGNHNDWFLVQGGSNATGYYVWDVVRALDYMATRSDTDMTKVGITGASGGGLATLYAFAADDRFTAAAPVVYMASMELAPDNGCLCNHVPGTMQIGDRSDILAIQAPKPVFILGAQDDPEFPPNATTLTIAKLKAEWDLFNRQGVVHGKIYDGPHDYNQEMREAVVGFFDWYLRGVGDGGRVQQPRIQAINPEDRSLLVLQDPIANEKTMRDVSKSYFEKPPKDRKFAHVVEINGGMPQRGALNYAEQGTGRTRTVTFNSEPGFTTPGVLQLPPTAPNKLVIVLDDRGKTSQVSERTTGTTAYLSIDLLGTGELAGIELRYPTYLGRSVAFIAAWQIVRAREAMQRYATVVEIEAHGPLSSLAALYANHMDPGFAKTTGQRALREWKDVFTTGVPPAAVQPRAHLLPPLDYLYSNSKRSSWTFLPTPDPK